MKCRYCGKETNSILDVCNECANNNKSINNQIVIKNASVKDKSKKWFIISWIMLFLCGPFTYINALYWREFAWIALMTYSYFVRALVFLTIILSIVEIINLNKLKKYNSDKLGIASTRFTVINFGYLFTIVISYLVPIKISLLAIILSIWCVLSIIIVIIARKKANTIFYKLALITSIILLVVSTASEIYTIKRLFFTTDEELHNYYEKQKEKEKKEANIYGLGRDFSDYIYDYCLSGYSKIYLSQNITNAGLFSCNSNSATIYAINYDKKLINNYGKINDFNDINISNYLSLEYGKYIIILVEANSKKDVLDKYTNIFSSYFDSCQDWCNKYQYLVYYTSNIKSVTNKYELLVLLRDLLSNDGMDEEPICKNVGNINYCNDPKHKLLNDYLQNISISKGIKEAQSNKYIDAFENLWISKNSPSISNDDNQTIYNLKMDKQYENMATTDDKYVDIYVVFQDNQEEKYVKYLEEVEVYKMRSIQGEDELLFYAPNDKYDILFKSTYLKVEVFAIKKGKSFNNHNAKETAITVFENFVNSKIN